MFQNFFRSSKAGGGIVCSWLSACDWTCIEVWEGFLREMKTSFSSELRTLQITIGEGGVIDPFDPDSPDVPAGIIQEQVNLLAASRSGYTLLNGSFSFPADSLLIAMESPPRLAPNTISIKFEERFSACPENFQRCEEFFAKMIPNFKCFYGAVDFESAFAKKRKASENSNYQLTAWCELEGLFFYSYFGSSLMRQFRLEDREMSDQLSIEQKEFGGAFIRLGDNPEEVTVRQRMSAERFVSNSAFWRPRKRILHPTQRLIPPKSELQKDWKNV